MNLFFTGTAYLGIPQHLEFRELLFQGIRQYGTHYGGSRLANHAPPVFEAAEQYLAAYAGAEAALVFSSGSLAGQVLLKVLRKEAQLVLAPGVHPALWDQEGPEEEPWETWTEKVADWCKQAGPPLALLCNSVDPLGVRPYDFSFLSALQPQRRVILVIDDSHGFCLLGPDGAGAYPSLSGLQDIEPLVISSLGKAGGIPAGMILGSHQWINKIRKSPFFGGASPPPPAYLHAFLEAKSLYREQRALLNKNLDYFTAQLRAPESFTFFPGFPVFLCHQHTLAAALGKKHIQLSSFPYPSLEDPVVTRIVLQSSHTRQELDYLLAAMG